MIQGKINTFGKVFSDAVMSAEVGNRTFSGVSIDSRTVSKDNLFFCVTGEKHDGHDFVQAALAKGAAAVVIEKAKLSTFDKSLQEKFVVVDHTLTTMQELAKQYLSSLKTRKIAITGTNGKTTAKNLITQILSSHCTTCATRGNFNNQFGVPLSIFEFDQNCAVAIFEFAMSTPGEIARLVEIVDPDIRVILNIGPAHLATLKNIETVAEAKFEILQNADPDQWAVLNMDDPNIRSRSFRHRLKKLSFGLGSENEVRPEKVYTNGSGHAHLTYAGQEITLPILGSHHIYNSLAAIAVAKLLDVPVAKIKAGIESFVPVGYRMVTTELYGVTIINDAYNSNPISAIGALETITAMQVRGKRFVVFGDMLELGDKAEEYHRQIGEKLARSKIDRVALYGDLAEVVRNAAISSGMSPTVVRIFTTHSQIVEYLADQLTSGDLLLLKASRALQLEKVEQGLAVILGRKN